MSLIQVSCILLVAAFTQQVPTESIKIQVMPEHARPGANLGSSLAIVGKRLLIAADGSSGSRASDAKSGAGVYAFVLEENKWVEQQKLPQPESSTARMGWSLDFDGERAIVGAIGDEKPGVEFRGIAGIYLATQEGWKLQHVVQVDRTRSFGWSVAIAGDYAFVSALHGETRGVWVYRQVADAWRLEQTITPPDSGSNEFGFAIDASDRTLAVCDRSGETVYVYERVDGLWTLTSRLTDAEGKRGDWLGSCVSISGNRMIVGAPQFEHRDKAGRALVFQRQDGRWALDAVLTAPASAPGDWFGTSVAMCESRAVVGAYGDDGPNGPVGRGSGSCYLFERSDAGWKCLKRLVASDPGTTTSFGNDVAISHDWIVASAPDHHVGTKGTLTIEPGRVFLQPTAR